MSELTRSPAWKALQAHHQSMAQLHMRDLFHEDPQRFAKFSLRFNDILLDYSKNSITEETLGLLLDLARQARLKSWSEKMFRGEKINSTENRAALHVALRNPGNNPVVVDGKDVMPGVRRVLAQMRAFSEAVRSGDFKGHTGEPFSDVVNIGIGGSHLGPQMVIEALTPYSAPNLGIHFVSNVDPNPLAETLQQLDPETTLFIVASKTFSTQETLANARCARDWLLAHFNSDTAAARHFAAVTANREEAAKFGIAANNIFEFWDWVGGRYSLWSATGLPIALAIGMDNFQKLLDGAHEMDQHFAEAPLESNLPVILGLLGVWYINFFGARSHAVLPYDQHFARFPAYLQQLEMESNGKRVARDGKEVDYATGCVVWGEPGVNGQHAFYQLLHQGTQTVPADFIAAIETRHPLGQQHEILLSNFLAQTEALMRGKSESEARDDLLAQGMSQENMARLAPHKVVPGNKPTNSILVKKSDPKTLGSLIALYEHKVFAQSVIWNINPFDQWGVELGKQLAAKILSDLAAPGAARSHDCSTNGLINHYKAFRKPD